MSDSLFGAADEQLSSQLQHLQQDHQQLRQQVDSVHNQKLAAEAECHAIGKQMDALREQLVAQVTATLKLPLLIGSE